jgi:hypothetical protein
MVSGAAPMCVSNELSWFGVTVTTPSWMSFAMLEAAADRGAPEAIATVAARVQTADFLAPRRAT